jgi:hypothetical protein
VVAVVAVVLVSLHILATLQMVAVQASSSSPMLAHNNSVAVSSPLWVATPFIHLLHQALFRLLHLCQQAI